MCGTHKPVFFWVKVNQCHSSFAQQPGIWNVFTPLWVRREKKQWLREHRLLNTLPRALRWIWTSRRPWKECDYKFTNQQKIPRRHTPEYVANGLRSLWVWACFWEGQPGMLQSLTTAPIRISGCARAKSRGVVKRLMQTDDAVIGENGIVAGLVYVP